MPVANLRFAHRVFASKNSQLCSKNKPIHVHIAEGKPVPHATKVWITKDGRCSLANNNSKIPQVILNKIMRVIEARSFEIIAKWKEYFGEVKFYC